ncbi:hypothetical protein [Streptomyces candidus]|uniref:Putative coiled-coil protein SlyX n=1 Tax=Streptomyces candidus TaxID=67283 RepID=A0A7X0LT47_9ACTN|nr:hypothetical protein [Streptomyces candidus]MBB6439950.1 putative coiled-coil protein SlyX [Streptomyces candidus]GHH56137.1 hypothetical protein GCM10018773_61560 [Streptomyces candidus]
MTDTTTPAETETPRRAWFPVRLVRTSVLDALRADLAQADTDVTTYEAEAENWHAAYCTEVKVANDAEERLDKAGDRLAALEQQVEELSSRLAESGREVEHLTRSLREVADERTEARQLAAHLQQAEPPSTAGEELDQ